VTRKTEQSPRKVTTNDKRKHEEEERQKVPSSKDDTFREFRRVCSNVADIDAYTDKTAIIKRMFTQGTHGGKHRSSHCFNRIKDAGA